LAGFFFSRRANWPGLLEKVGCRGTPFSTKRRALHIISPRLGPKFLFLAGHTLYRADWESRQRSC